MPQQMKSLHWWLMTLTVIADFVGAQTNLFTPKTIGWVLFAHGIMMILVQQLAAKWKADEEPKFSLPGEIAKVLLPIALLGTLMSGCAGTQVVKDVTAQCGVKVVSAVTQTALVLKTATSADAALAQITQILGAVGSDYEAIYCVISEAVKSLKAQRSNTGGLAPPEMQMRAMTADGPSLPSDPTAHGIALGEDLLREQARTLVIAAVGAP